ncbi:hypothetical protein SYNPS1DRAFT_28932 [Syncephalis pseudoplumigaleata]|uniref:Uncharacterized protein n=1 Tax=Syncephalis pseudoplumigaleata TaxID=1712513 RepID=A0A4P9YYU2_9FUNG|nr:hypothetical protein SYNPS1DRAFT_28932 [Syncephalis pseudoplumigaleata]|eukprot:RKP25333.1 hypothetical protein SYNPS1DRAFT_28932 [Syncephalis pseudoplumigaleata]
MVSCYCCYFIYFFDRHLYNARKHKGNVERFLRDTHERLRQEKEENAAVAKEMAKINQAAQSAYTLDLGRGNVARAPSSIAASASSTTATSSADNLRKRPASPVSTLSSSSSSGVVAKAEARPSRIRSTAPVQAAFRLPEDDQVGAVGPWRAVEEPPATTTSTAAAGAQQANASKQRTQQIIGSSVANDLLQGDEDEEKSLVEADPNDPEDLRNYRVIEKSHPTDYEEHDIHAPPASKQGSAVKQEEEDAVVFKKRKTSSTANRARNIRRK